MSSKRFSLAKISSTISEIYERKPALAETLQGKKLGCQQIEIPFSRCHVKTILCKFIAEDKLQTRSLPWTCSGGERSSVLFRYMLETIGT